MGGKRLLHQHRLFKGCLSARSLRGFASLQLWCTQDTRWQFFPLDSKGIRQPGLLFLLHLSQTPCYCSADTQVFICLHLKTFHFTAIYRWAAPVLTFPLLPERVPLQHVKQTQERNGIVRIFRTAQGSTFAGLGENSNFKVTVTVRDLKSK